MDKLKKAAGHVANVSGKVADVAGQASKYAGMIAPNSQAANIIGKIHTGAQAVSSGAKSFSGQGLRGRGLDGLPAALRPANEYNMSTKGYGLLPIQNMQGGRRGRRRGRGLGDIIKAGLGAALPLVNLIP